MAQCCIICFANQMTGFCMKCNTGMKWVYNIVFWLCRSSHPEVFCKIENKTGNFRKLSGNTNDWSCRCLPNFSVFKTWSVEHLSSFNCFSLFKWWRIAGLTLLWLSRGENIIQIYQNLSLDRVLTLWGAEGKIGVQY